MVVVVVVEVVVAVTAPLSLSLSPYHAERHIDIHPSANIRRLGALYYIGFAQLPSVWASIFVYL